MQVRVCPIQLGFTNCYLIQSDGILLVDTPVSRDLARFSQTLRSQCQLDMNKIERVVITHAHFDHYWAAARLQRSVGAQVVVHKEDRAWLEKGFVRAPPGVTTWGHMLRLLMLPAAAFIRVESCSPDLVIDSAERSLLDWGIPGRLIHTPGHTPGSMSLLLRSGEAFVGDLAMDAMPMRISPGLPVFAEDIDEVRESWKRLLEQGAKTIYPAHGDPFSAEVIKKQILQVHERPQTIRAGA